MSSTHLSLNYHVIFSTKNREPWIAPEWETRLHAYLGGCVKKTGGIPIEINGMPDHVHLIIGLKATQCIANVVRDNKAPASAWVHSDIHVSKFQWQDGYAAFTVSASVLEIVREYVRDQKVKHTRYSFKQEYLKLLKTSGIAYDARYLW